MPSTDKSCEPVNYLIQQKPPTKTEEEFYEFEKLTKTEFGQVWGQETHKRRRKLILQKHPQVAKLLSADKPYTVILAVICIISALGVCYLVKDSSWTVFLLTNYFVGSTIAHTIHVLIHDFTHFSALKSMNANRAMAILCNVAIGIPSAIPFGKHHADHHNYLNEKGKDPDLPLEIQAKFIKNNPVCKVFFWFFLTLIYGARPMFFYDTKLTKEEIYNLIFCICTNYIIYKYWGINAIGYIILCAFFSIGPHPASIHVLAEHFQFVQGLETYDYFGPFNIINLNMGYHIQHHDFPTCPWYNLPKVRAAAPEFYEHLPHHTSYFKLIFKFLFDFKYNLYNRTIRVPDDQIQNRKQQ